MPNVSSSLVDKLTACPLCQSSEFSSVPAPPVGIGQLEFGPVASQLGLMRCDLCRVVFVNPRPAQELLNTFYNRDGYDCHNPHFAANWGEGDLLARFGTLTPYVKRKDLLLDFGAGAGHLLRYAQRDGWARVAGIEVGSAAREMLKNEGLEVYVDSADAGRGVGQVDAVTMIQVLEHLTAPHETLREIHRLLRSDGVFLVEVPNAASLRARLAASFMKPLWTTNVQRYLAFPIHLLYFNTSSLRTLLEREGFKVLHLGTIGMGVEELRSPPASTQSTSNANSSGTRVGRPSDGRALEGAKRLIKKTVSTLRFGEQLLAVCRKA